MVNGISIKLSVEMTSKQLAECPQDLAIQLADVLAVAVKINVILAKYEAEKHKSVLVDNLATVNKLMAVLEWLGDKGYDLTDDNKVIKVPDTEMLKSGQEVEPDGL